MLARGGSRRARDRSKLDADLRKLSTAIDENFNNLSTDLQIPESGGMQMPTEDELQTHKLATEEYEAKDKDCKKWEANRVDR